MFKPFYLIIPFAPFAVLLLNSFLGVFGVTFPSAYFAVILFFTPLAVYSFFLRAYAVERNEPQRTPSTQRKNAKH
jgi:hypothetical protein